MDERLKFIARLLDGEEMAAIVPRASKGAPSGHVAGPFRTANANCPIFGFDDLTSFRGRFWSGIHASTPDYRKVALIHRRHWGIALGGEM